MQLIVDSLVPDSYLESARKAGLDRLAWKFVVLEKFEVRHFVCGPVAEYPYHANLVDGYCRLAAIASSWERRPDLVQIFDSTVRIRGGGHLRINLTERRMKVYGRSTAYGHYDPVHLAGLADAGAPFDGYNLEIVGL